MVCKNIINVNKVAKQRLRLVVGWLGHAYRLLHRTIHFVIFISSSFTFSLHWISAKISSSAHCDLVNDDVIKWKHFPRYWPFVRGIHRSQVNSPHKGQWRGALMFSLICVWINAWVNNREAGDLRRHRAHCDVIVMNVIWRFWCMPVPDQVMAWFLTAPIHYRSHVHVR